MAVWWGFDRGAGLVALVLLTLATLVAVAGRGRSADADGGLRSVQRTLALGLLAFGAVHVLGVVIGGADGLRALDAVVPFAAASDPFWTGLGTLAFDLLLAVGITLVVRRRLGPRGWRAVEWIAYPVWALALLHAVGMGTDLAGTWGLAVVSGCVGLVAAVLALRFGIVDAPDEAAAPPQAPLRPVAPEPPPEPEVPEPEPAPSSTYDVPSPLWSRPQEPLDR